MTPYPTPVMTQPPFATGDCDSVPDVMSVNFGYYQSWAIWRHITCSPIYPEDIDVGGNQYTHLAYSFAGINAAFELEPWGGDYAGEVPMFNRFNGLKQDNPNLKTLIAVGGWTFNDPGPTQTRFSVLSASASARVTFANSVVSFCRTVRVLALQFNLIVSLTHTLL